MTTPATLVVRAIVQLHGTTEQLLASPVANGSTFNARTLTLAAVNMTFVAGVMSPGTVLFVPMKTTALLPLTSLDFVPAPPIQVSHQTCP
jgi:hypothetical protein